jgi:hypothetical protein
MAPCQHTCFTHLVYKSLALVVQPTMHLSNERCSAWWCELSLRTLFLVLSLSLVAYLSCSGTQHTSSISHWKTSVQSCWRGDVVLELKGLTSFFRAPEALCLCDVELARLTSPDSLKAHTHTQKAKRARPYANMGLPQHLGGRA